MTTNSPGNIPTGVAGTVLQGQGIGNASDFSTATYPATAGTSGNVLTSDGTDWTSAAPIGTGTVTNVSGTVDQVAVANGTTTPVISLVGPYTPATYTAHGVLIGESNTSIVALGAGTAGQVLQSGGPSADPAYSTATYPSTAGTSGNVLTSDGTNWVSSPPSSGSDPLGTITLVDDFVGAISSAASILSNLSWIQLSSGNTSNAPGNSDTEAGHPGTVGNSTGGGAPADIAIYLGPSGATVGNQCLILGGGEITLTWVFKINTLSTVTNTYNVGLGLFYADDGLVVPDNGIYLTYTNAINSGNWQFVCANGGTKSTNSSAIAASTGWHKLVISINAAATSVTATIDGASLGAAITTNIPTAFQTVFGGITVTNGTVPAKSFIMDLMVFNQTLTTSR